MKKIIKFNKLVRDKIPDIIRNNGEIPYIQVLSDKEYFIALKKKLVEEINEFQESDSIEELADILEVVISIACQLGYDSEKLEKIRAKKRLARGGFSDKILLLKKETI